VLTRKVDGPRIIVLAARSWEVTYIDWKRRRCYVEPSDIPARMKWMGDASPLSYELTQGHRRVLLGADPEVALSKRAVAGLVRLREDHGLGVSERGLVLLDENRDVWWWTWAGTRANATLLASLAGVVDPNQRIGNFRLRLLGHDAIDELRSAAASADLDAATPTVSPAALQGLKFAEVLPRDLATETVAARLGDVSGARRTLETTCVRVVAP